MAAVVGRFMTAALNLLKASGVVLSADSALLSLPIRFVLDQLRSKVWRSDGPWVVVAGFNDKLNVSRLPGPIISTATLTPGTYASAAAYFAMVQARLLAADGVPAWAITYNTVTMKATIATGTAVTLLTGTGADLATSAWKDMGFTTGADNNGAGGLGVSFVSDNAVAQSRHYFAADLGSSLAHTVAIVLGHNLAAGGTITLKGSNTSVLDALTAGTSQALTTLVDSEKAYKYFGSQSFRYLAFLIDDTTNTAGFSQLAIPYVGTYIQSTVAYDNTFGELGEDLSVVLQATDGAPFGDQRSENPGWTFRWADVSKSSGDLALFQAFRAATLKGKCFFFDLDQGLASPTTMVYGYRETALPIPVTSGDYYSPAFTFRQALP